VYCYESNDRKAWMGFANAYLQAVNVCLAFLQADP